MVTNLGHERGLTAPQRPSFQDERWHILSKARLVSQLSGSQRLSMPGAQCGDPGAQLRPYSAVINTRDKEQVAPISFNAGDSQ